MPVSVKRDSTPPSPPQIVGLSTQVYTPDTLPGSISCSSFDTVSDVTSCVLTGFDASIGPHTVTAVATNGAGLTSSSALAYVVAQPPATPPPPTPPVIPPAASGLAVSKGTLTALARSGMTITLSAAEDVTNLAVTLRALVPKASGHGTHYVSVGSTKVTVHKGIAHVKIRLTSSGARKVAKLEHVTFRITVTGRALGAKLATLHEIAHAQTLIRAARARAARSRPCTLKSR